MDKEDELEKARLEFLEDIRSKITYPISKFFVFLVGPLLAYSCGTEICSLAHVWN